MTTPLPAGWETQVLQGIGAPVTQQNIQNLDLWQRAEGGSTNNPDSYNPFNTTLGTYGGSSTNSVGVKAFSSWGQGLDATIATIEQSNMAGIDNALKANSPTPQFEAAVNSSPWGTHFGGAQLTGFNILNPLGLPGPFSGQGLLNEAAGGVASLGTSAASSFVKDLVNSGLVLRGTLIVVGLIILFIGLRSLFDGNATAGQVAGSGAQSVTVHVKSAASKVGKGAGEAAAA
jgi:hypothetical protein